MLDEPLIHIDIPDHDAWEDSLAARILFVICGLLLFRVGFDVWAALMPGFLVGGVASILLFGTGAQLLVFAALDIDSQTWAPRVAVAVVLVLGFVMAIALYRFWLDKIQTDALLFSRAALAGLVDGRNPYAMDMEPWVRSWRGPQFSTPQLDGTMVSQLSYPSGAILWFVPQFASVGETRYGIRATLVVAALAAGLVVTISMPRRLAMAGPVSLLAARNLVKTAAGGVFWPIWILPILLAIRDWSRGNWWRVGLWLGIAAGSKQLAWILGPYLLIWGLKEERVDLFAVATGTTGTFMLMNLPFIVWDPRAWLTSVLTPVGSGAPLVFQGVGFATIPLLGFQVARWWFALLVLAAVATTAAAYWLYFDELRWSAWLAPSVILLFHSRSLTSYFVAAAPLGVVCAAAMKGRLRTDSMLALATDRLAHWRGVVHG